MSFIETPRLLIRTWMASDAAALEAIYGDGETMRYIGRGYPQGLPPETTRAALAAMIARYESDGIGVWPVVLKESGELIGACGLQPLPKTDETEIAFLFNKAFRGKGYAYEAAAAVMEFGFAQARVPRIVAVVNPRNARSIALINKLGMRFEGVVRAYQSDLLKYAKEAST